jgi:hypothetical protein
MKKILLLSFILLMFLTGTASAYGLYLTCPDTVQVGQTLKCSIDTSANYPVGTSFDLIFYQAQYTATELDRQTVTIQPTRATQYKLFDTRGLKGGQYKMEIDFQGSAQSQLSDDSVTNKLITLIDRSNLITITSPLTQTTDDALHIDGSIAKEGANGVQIEVRGQSIGTIFGPQYIRTTNNMQTGAGMFSQMVKTSQPGDYDVYFTDTTGFIGDITYHVTSPTPVQTPTTIPTKTVIKTPTKTLTPLSTPTPSPTQSPLSIFVVLGALGVSALICSGTLRSRK